MLQVLGKHYLGHDWDFFSSNGGTWKKCQEMTTMQGKHQAMLKTCLGKLAYIGKILRNVECSWENSRGC